MSSREVDITVCILSYNRPEYLREMLLSVLDQTVQPREIVIFDNASNPSVNENIADLLGNNVKWFGSQEQKSAICNFERAVAYTKTKYIVILHDDDRVLPNFLESQLKFLLQNVGKIVAVGCNANKIDEDGKYFGGELISLSEKGEPEYYECSGNLALRYLNHRCIPFASILYETQILKEVKIRGEYGKVCDVVLQCDISDNGGIAYQQEPLYLCRIHSEQDSSLFSFPIIKKLNEFYWTRTTINFTDRAKLRSMIRKQNTENLMSFCIETRSKTGSVWQVIKLFLSHIFKKCSYSYLSKRLIRYLIQNLRFFLKKVREL